MKRYLVERGGYVHMILFALWFLPIVATFCCGTKMFEEAMWIPMMALIAIVLQLCLGIAEADWAQEILDESGYGRS